MRRNLFCSGIIFSIFASYMRNTNTEIINDLIQIEQNKANDYEKLLVNGNFDGELNRLIRQLADQCRNNVLELRSHMSENTGSDPADHVEIPGEMKDRSFNANRRKPPAFMQDRVHAEA